MYRQAINISSHSSPESNVYLTTTINIGNISKVQSDGGDFRFTDAGGNLLPYYLISGIGTTAITFHVQLDSFPSGAQTIYVYYGNPSATNGFSASDFSTAASNYTISSLGTEETGGAPVAWWKFDEGTGTTAHDSSSYNNNGIFGNGSSAPTWTDESQCIIGKCLYFDGTNDQITIPSLPKTNTPYTVSFWIKAQKNNAEQTIISLRGPNSFPKFELNANNKLLAYSGPEKYRYSSKIFTASDLNQWYYITFITADSSSLSGWKIYVNGQESSGTTGSNTGTYFEPSTSGTIGSASGLQYFQGFLDDVKIYNYTRTAAQVLQDYNAGISGQSSSESTNTSFDQSSQKSLSDGLVGYWKFDEGVGTSSADSSGNNKTAIFGTGDSAPTWFSAKYGIGLSFNGTSNYANISSFNIPYDQTISLWLKPSDTSNNEWIINLGPSWHYELSIRSNKLAFSTHDSSSNYLYCTGTTNLSNNNFYHITTTYNNTTKEKNIYINGILDKTCTQQESNIAGTTNQTISIGGGSYISGLIDEIRIYNRALSPEEVKQLYNYAPGPIGYWKFDEGVGTTVFDSSGNNNNLRWIGGSNYYQSGKYNKSGYFNSDRRAELSDTSKLNLANQSFTLGGWIKWGVNNIVIPFAKGTNGYSTPGFYVYQNSNTIYFYVGDGTNYIQPYVNFASYRYSWNYYTFTYDSTLKKGTIYINGVPLASSANINIASIGNTLPFMFGASSAGYNWQGNLDEVKVYNYARTQEQILQDMQGDSTSSKLAGPIVWYKLDNSIGNTIPNSGSLGNQAKGTSTINTPQFSSGKIDKSLNFTGSNYVNIGISIPTQAYTKSLWLKYAPGGLNYNIMSGSNGNVLYAANGIGNKLASGHNGAWTTVQDSVALDTNWHHVVVTYDSQSNGSLKLYKDTVLISSAVGVSPPSGDTGFYLGAWNGGNTWVGQLDDVKIYNYALSADEIKADYNQSSSVVFGVTNLTVGNTSTSATYCVPGSTDPCSPPIGEWKFEEGVGTTAYDTSGNNKNGVFGSGSAAPSWSTGKIGKSLSFDGGDSVTVGTKNDFNFGTGSFTFSIWAKFGSARIVMPFAKALAGYSSPGFRLYVNPSNLMEYAIMDGTNTCASSADISNYTNSWNQYTVVWDSTIKKCSFYINNRYINSNTNTNIASVSNTNLPLIFGASSSGYNFQGYLDNILIYDYARTPAQIAWDYNQGAPIGWWKFDECQGSVVNDSSGIGNTGSITIGANGTQNSLGTCQVGTSATWTNGATGKINSSLNFDGTDDKITINNSSLFQLSNGTISAWIKTTNAGSAYRGIIAKQNAYGMFLRNNEFGVYDWTTNSWRGSGFSPNDGNWHHLLCTFQSGINNGTLCYVDGQLILTTTTTVYNQPITLQIAEANASQYFSGQIDDVRIYNYTLTSEQIKQVYNGGAINFN